jgi:signal transduction histidine kinase
VVSETQHGEVLAALAAHLRVQREAILADWRRAVDADPQLTTASALSRAQFIDHIPEVLDTFEQQLCAKSYPEQRAALEEQKDGAAAHGLQRWQQGYNQRETARDWGHLQLCLLAEIDAFEDNLAAAGRRAMLIARRALARLVSDGVSESASQYAQMRQAEAATQVAELELALKSLTALQEQRAGVWREAAHDLRGSVGILHSASTVLDREGAPEAVRRQSLQILKRGVQSLHELLSDLADLARIEAGHDRLALETFDVSATLRHLCESLREVANERNLFLRVIGPGTLDVHGDRIKIVRVAQNLLLNALRYTSTGGVTLEWEEHGTAARPQWRMSVIDSGPGITQTSSAPIAQALEEATRATQRLAGEPTAPEVQPDSDPRGAGVAADPRQKIGHGEGIGLTIVKRLCEVLEASLELESRHEGTTFRVTLPRQYA